MPVERLLQLGAETYEGGSAGMFNMAVMGLRLAQRANGVSQLHGVVSREMFDGLWPGFDDDEVPITSITNGVHGPTWVDRKVFELARTHADVHELDTQESWEAFADRAPGRRLGHQARAARAARRRGPSPHPPVLARARAPRRPSSAGPTRSSTPTCSPSASPAGCRPTSGSP